MAGHLTRCLLVPKVGIDAVSGYRFPELFPACTVLTSVYGVKRIVPSGLRKRIGSR